MAWEIIVEDKALKVLKKLDKPIAARIIDFMENKISTSINPRTLGATLQGSELGDFWKYRVGDYRIIAQILDREVKILVVKIGNRKEVYR
jgi:mRNA interferase RelE/StbE